MKQPEINTMILGQTGVGKSTLINYLYGEDVVRTGTGKPVTGRGDFTKISVPSPIKSGVKINIFDSWGLESDKAEDWENVIDGKLNGKLSFDEMIYAIVYCSSYANDRVQDFEIRMLKKLLSKKYKVTIALTNADNSGFAAKKTVFREKYAKELAEYRGNYGVVDICAQAKPKLGQSAATAQVFGKEELFRELENDFLINFVNVLHARWTEWKDESIAKLNTFRKAKVSEIEDFKRKWLDTNEAVEAKIGKLIGEGLKELSSDIQSKIENTAADLQTWYKQAAGAFYRGSLGFDMWEKMPATDFFRDVEAKDNKLQGFFDWFNLKERREKKKQLQELLYEAVDAVKDKINESYSKVERMREDLKRAQRGKNS
jgi:GTP-binding protein EngB required for normal cell division